jgi:hypothetical protein
MKSPRIISVLRRAIGDLEREKVSFAVIGGLAVSARTEPRFTRCFSPRSFTEYGGRIADRMKAYGIEVPIAFHHPSSIVRGCRM